MAKVCAFFVNTGEIVTYKYELDTNMRTTIVSILLFATMISAKAQLLFRISGGRLEKPSYMLGSLHVVSGEMLERYDAFLDAEKQCQQLYVEYDVTDEQHRKELQETGLKIANLPDSLTIFEVLGDKRTKVLADRMQECAHLNLKDSAAMTMWYWQPFMFTNIINLMKAGEVLTQVPTLQKLKGKGMFLGSARFCMGNAVA